MAKLPLGGVNQAGLGELWGRIRFLFLGLVVYRARRRHGLTCR